MNKGQKRIIIVLVGCLIVATGIAIVIWNKEGQPSVNSRLNNQANVPSKEGVLIRVLKSGNGREAKNGDTVTVNYAGNLQDGRKFDSSWDRGAPFSFILGVGQVIRGWDIGVLGMKIGEMRKLTIPPELAYGSGGAGGIIPPNATLVFEIELLNIKN